jgi:hypothetical protein
MASGLDSTKTPARPSHEAIESTGGQATEIGETPLEHVDREAMESAKRAQNRIHADEGKVPGTQIFTK